MPDERRGASVPSYMQGEQRTKEGGKTVHIKRASIDKGPPNLMMGKAIGKICCFLWSEFECPGGTS